ncbi:glycosyltransferase [Scytonema sp. UIC 10036]|uniref:glycosyltransferase family 2 protein n=1 Tax=Scytonema sp. UIC 10036 TaxID=2304196 RepID=UPI0012DAC723|nr:glycosyltransferase [Scytonema sp. UIC 10036]MUH01598.1 glycosyltransferase [Scytonema sp. UIC 10036]
MTKVSIIIPAYNTSRYIKRAIESALSQTEQNIEIIVVDDASTDNTVEVVNSFSDPRIKLLVNESNQGPSYSRNRAIKEAKGEWVALLDSDDWYAPKRLERLLQLAEKENADLIADDIYLIPEGEESPWSITVFEKNALNLNQPKQIDMVYFVDRYLSITKPLIKLNFLVKHNLQFNESLKYEEDFVLFLLCLLNGGRFFIVPEPYYFYQMRIRSLMKEYVDFYEQACKTNLYLLQQEFTQENAQLKRTLSKRLRTMKQTRAFYQVRQALKEGAFLTALIKAVLNPNFLPVLWEKLPGIFKYHILYRFHINFSK